MRNFNKLITFIILLGSFMNLQSQNKYSNRKIDNLKNQAVQLVEENKKLTQVMVDKVFRKISKQLNLYYIKDSTRNRPLYSLRSTSAIETSENTNATIDDLAMLGNTSAKMLNTRYLRKYQEQKIIEIQERIYSKKK